MNHPTRASGQWVVTSSGLFLPRSLVVPSQTSEHTTHLMRYWKVTLALADLHGSVQPFEAVVESFRSYGIAPALNLLSRAEQLLRHAKYSEAMEAQRYLAKQFLGPSTLHQIEQWIQHNAKTEDVRLFSEQQLLKAIFLAVVYSKRKDRAALKTAPFESLGITLLSITNHLEPIAQAIPKFSDVPQVSQKKQFAEMILRNGLFNHRDDYRHHHVRHFEMFCEIASDLHGHSQFINLDRLHKRMTGLRLPTFIGTGLALLSAFPIVTRDNAGETPTFVLLNSFLPRKDFRRTSRKFFHEIGTSRGRFRQAYRRDSFRSQNSAYNFLEIQRHPLLHIRKNRAVCLSRRFLIERIGSGLHHRFLSIGSETEKRRYLNFCGVLFEEYVRRICNRMYHDGRFASRITYGRNLEAADGWIVYPPAAIVLEAKASRFTLDIFLEGRFGGFEKKFRENILEGARQLDRVIRDFKNGSFTINGLTASTLSVFYPVIVTQQYIPLDLYLSEYIRDTIQSEELLAAPGIHPIQIIHIEDLEHLEAIVATGTSFLDLLNKRESNSVWKHWPFSNFLFEQFPDGLPQSGHIVDKYRELLSRAAWQLLGQRLK
jgi:hypothetical protein